MDLESCTTMLTSKTSVALGGINGGDPRLPYAKAGGIINFRSPPSFMPVMPSSHPLITSWRPRAKKKGLPLTFLSKILPPLTLPIYRTPIYTNKHVNIMTRIIILSFMFYLVAFLDRYALTNLGFFNCDTTWQMGDNLIAMSIKGNVVKHDPTLPFLTFSLAFPVPSWLFSLE